MSRPFWEKLLVSLSLAWHGRERMKGSMVEASPIFLLSFSCSSAEKSSLSFLPKNVQKGKIEIAFPYLQSMSEPAFPWHFGANNKKLCNSAPSLLNLSFSFSHLFKLHNVFVQIAKSVFVHLLSSTSPSPSPFPFPILELKISRFRIFKRNLRIEFVPAIYLANKKKGEEEVGEMF